MSKQSAKKILNYKLMKQFVTVWFRSCADRPQSLAFIPLELDKPHGSRSVQEPFREPKSFSTPPRELLKISLQQKKQ
jgi:hypothetical protein